MQLLSLIMTSTILISNIHVTPNIHCHNIPRQEHDLCLVKPGPRPASLAVHHPHAGSEGWMPVYQVS